MSSTMQLLAVLNVLFAMTACAQVDVPMYSIPKHGSPPSQSLLQLEDRFLLADAEIARAFQERHADPNKLGNSLKAAIEASDTAIKKHFMQKPPDIVGGLEVLGEGLFADLKKPLEKHFRGSELDEFKEKFMEYFNEDASQGDGIKENFDAYEKTGKPQKAVTGVSNIIEELSLGIEGMIPEKTATEISKFLDSYIDTLDSLSDGWTNYLDQEAADEDEKKANQEQAVKDMDKGMKKAIKKAVPKKALLIEMGVFDEAVHEREFAGGVRGDGEKEPIADTVMGTIDGVVKGLSQNILEFQKALLEGEVCYKGVMTQKPNKPSVCPNGLTCSGGSCYRVALFEDNNTVRELELDGAIARKGSPRRRSGGGGGSRGGGAMPCDCEAEFMFGKDKRNCYPQCPKGTAAKGSDTRNCDTDCNQLTRMPMTKSGFCGANVGVITDAQMKMVMAIIQGIMSAVTLIMDMTKNGVSADKLTKTLNVFVDMAKPFVKPMCKEQYEEIPDDK